MKRNPKLIIASLVAICVLSSSCATVFGGRVNSYQRTKPKEGQQQRSIRPVALIADIILFWPGLIVDFATAAIYKPNPPAENSPAASTEVKTTSSTSN